MAASALVALAVGGPAPVDPTRSGSSNRPRAARTSHEVRLAERLTAIGASDLLTLQPSFSPKQARRLASRRQRLIALPSGGNFAGIRWGNAPRPINPALIEQVIEYNARCQWMRALAEGRQVAESAEIVRLSARWPALRSAAATSSTALAECYATHRREVAFALSRHRRPSS